MHQQTLEKKATVIESQELASRGSKNSDSGCMQVQLHISFLVLENVFLFEFVEKGLFKSDLHHNQAL